MTRQIKIIVDAFGGDNAPLAVLQGCRAAADEYSVDIMLAGSEEKIKKCAAENSVSLMGMEILDAPRVMDMEADPASILRENADTSMAVGLKALAEGRGDAFVSAGSTGALTVGATFIVKRIKGIKRPCIASLMPSRKNPFLLLDCGANAECRPEMLESFALMGDAYARSITDNPSPSVALANIGTERTKGGELQKKAYELMEKSGAYRFIGNIEARNIPFGEADVVVADGFTGNMLLKMYEGTAMAMSKSIKDIVKKNIFTKLSAVGLLGGLAAFKKQMDYTEYGGASLLGLKKPVIKAHGSSNAKAIKSAVRHAMQFADSDIIARIENQLSAAKEEETNEES